LSALLVLALAGTAEAARLSIPEAVKLAHKLEAQQRGARHVQRQTLGPAHRTSAERVTFSYSDLNSAGNYRCRATILVRLQGSKRVASFTGVRCANV
jgi:hypothetical protein